MSFTVGEDIFMTKGAASAGPQEAVKMTRVAIRWRSSLGNAVCTDAPPIDPQRLQAAGAAARQGQRMNVPF
jgi:hypothetical protein